jgi:hypothetical protein
MNMNPIKWMAWVLLAGCALAKPAWSQSETSPQFNPDSANPTSSELSQPQADELEVDSAEPLQAPLQVTEQDRDRFFTPAPRPQTIESAPSGAESSDSLIQPPPGSQTPGQLTPARRLSFPIP